LEKLLFFSIPPCNQFLFYFSCQFWSLFFWFFEVFFSKLIFLFNFIIESNIKFILYFNFDLHSFNYHFLNPFIWLKFFFSSVLSFNMWLIKNWTSCFLK
jgi:hypothetical protein